MNKQIYTFSEYLKEIFGERVHRISINAGFSCPNLDGKKSSLGCIYCNNDAFSVKYDNSISAKDNIKRQIVEGIKFYSTYYRIKKFIAYFQSYTNTYADIATLKEMYDTIKEFKEIVGISISTRPDCVNEEILELINSYTEEYLVWVEYGMQTSDDELLLWLNRNHTFKDFVNCVELTKKFSKINISAHLILGLPNQNVSKEAAAVVNLKLNGIKFHVLHVLKNTQLEKLYCDNKITIVSQKEYVDDVCYVLTHIPENVVVMRLVSTAATEMLVSPLWMNNKQKVISEIRQKLTDKGWYQGKFL